MPIWRIKIYTTVELQVVVAVALLDKLLALHLGTPVASLPAVLQRGLLVGMTHYPSTAERPALTEVLTSLSD